MCGIAGIISLGSRLGEKEQIIVNDMISVQRHRGPDSLGFYYDPNCMIASARLKIIDLSDNVRLPMVNEDESVWMAYNGMVTNYVELMEKYKLEEKHDFCSSSDTEVLVHLYEELGIEFVNCLTGHFAFCLYDKNIRRVFVVRDFFGLRPLFYMEKNNSLFFASELKSFHEVSGFSKEIDREAVYNYFTLAYIPEEALHTGMSENCETAS